MKTATSNTITPETTAAVLAILAGKPVPEEHPWARWSKGASTYLAGLVAEPPKVTADDLAELFPDDPPARPHEDQAAIDRYNALSPIERALIEAIIKVADQCMFEDVTNPILLHELHMAQRRTIEQLLAMAGVAVPD